MRIPEATEIRAYLLAPGPALHALRTAVAASVTYALTHVLGLEQGYWAVFSSILVMQANIGSSLAASRDRLLGTAAGAFLGAAVASLFGPGLWSTTGAMFLAMLVCGRLSAEKESLRLAALTAALVVSLHLPGANAFAIGLSRFLEVGLGIVVALAVLFAWPSRARVVLRRGLAEGLRHLAALLSALMDSRLSGTYARQRVFHAKDALLRLSLRNRQLSVAARREPGGSEERERLRDLLAAQDRLAEHLLAMDHAIEDAPAEGFHRHLPEELSELGEATRLLLLALADGVESGTGDAGAAAARLARALQASGAKLLELRQQRIIAVYDLDEVMHFYSFYHALRELAREAQALAGATGAAPPAPPAPSAPSAPPVPSAPSAPSAPPAPPAPPED